MRSNFQKRHVKAMSIITMSILAAIFFLVSCDLASLSSTVLVTGTVVDSTTGNGVGNANILISGDIVDTTASDGTFEFSCPTGTHTLIFTKTGYYWPSYTFTAVSGTPIVIAQHNAIANPDMTPNTIRIVLSWGASPSDLDSHLELPSGSPDGFEIYWSNKGNINTSTHAYLDVDDTSSYGPETITIKQLGNSYTYKYKVYNFSNSGTFSNSGANVRVFFDNNTFQDFTPPTGSGYTWDVFTITNTNITLTNTIN
jgi:hypothetical protein